MSVCTCACTCRALVVHHVQVWYNEASTSYKVCSTTDGEDPTCMDSLPLPIDTSDHDTYLNYPIDGAC